MKHQTLTRLTCLALLAGLFFGAASASANERVSSDLLLPYFEVDMTGVGVTTFFSVVNTSPDPVPLTMTAFTNWGIEVVSSSIVLEGDAVQIVNLSDWILRGKLPDKTLAKEELEHFQAVFTGGRSPLDGFYYGAEMDFQMAVGYVTIRLDGAVRPDVLFGDYFVVDPAEDLAQGDILVNIDQTQECEELCQRHALRFLSGGGFDEGTELLIWTSASVEPSESPYFPLQTMATADILAYKQSGEEIQHLTLDLMPLDVIKVSELGLDANSGWIDIITENASFIAVRHAAQKRFSVGLVTHCLPLPLPEPNPGPEQARILIEKSTNGHDADFAPGPTIEVGEPVLWEYLIANRGEVDLSDVVVTDDQGVAVSCPKDILRAGKTMLCEGHGTATAGQYRNVGTVTARTPSDNEIEDSDPSHYNGKKLPEPEPQDAAIDIEKATNGQDADAAPGPQLFEGDAVEWTYEVTNKGNVRLTNVAVSDDQGVAVSCPKSALNPDESMTCTGHGTATLGQYKNVGTATGQPPEGPEVSDSDPSHCFGELREEPAINLEKATNGHDADAAPGPKVTEGSSVEWTYEVTNTGNVRLSDITVTDNRGVAVSCPKSALNPGKWMTCTGSGTAILGQYSNLGTATGKSPEGKTVRDSDPSHYYGEPRDEPSIDLEKATNGHDADVAPGPTLTEGDAVTWTYLVRNSGNVRLTEITVTDNQGVSVSCPKSQLNPGQSMTCTGSGTATLGQYRNVGTATGKSPQGKTVDDSDPSHCYGEPREDPRIKLEKATNGHDADAAPGPTLTEGDAVAWTYVATNNGNVRLTDVTVTDDQGVAVSCPKSALDPGESMTCTGHGTAILGQYRNVGTATGKSPKGKMVDDSDPSHYYGEAPPPSGDQGCTPGYWKNHTDSWPPTGYSPGQSVQSVFSQASAYPAIGSASLLEALGFKGGSGVEGGARNLMRAAVAALLDSAHPGVSYPRTTSSVISSVNSALASGDRDAMLSLASRLDRDNNLGCPLN